MARPREFDLDETLDEIARTFWGNGFEATGISDLEAATGLARPRLYAAFGSKGDMLHRAIDRYLAVTIAGMLETVEGRGLGWITFWFNRFVLLRRERPELVASGCLMVNSLVELGNTDPEVVALGTRYRAMLRGAFLDALADARADGQVRGDIEARADLALLMQLGLFVSMKGGGDTEEVTRLVAIAVDTVESWREPVG